MPWKDSDVSAKTKRAKTPKAKAQWVAIANSMLAHGASEKKAIMTASGVIKKRA
jgi:uncharacterized protein YdaT